MRLTDIQGDCSVRAWALVSERITRPGADDMDGGVRAPVFERRYDDGEVAFHFTVDALRDAEMVVTGRGNMAGAHAMIGYLDEAVATLGLAGESRVYFDVSRVRGAPLRTQILFGKWFFKHRSLIGRAAVVGAGPFERRLAAAVCAFAGIRTFRFFETQGDARGWLGAAGTPSASPSAAVPQAASQPSGTSAGAA
jgi:hypothetical protein